MNDELIKYINELLKMCDDEYIEFIYSLLYYHVIGDKSCD